MVEAREMLVQFLEKALAVKRERLCAFASKPKAQHKFLFELGHRFGGYVKASAVVSDLPAAAWSAPALAFGGIDEFGQPFSSMREAWATVDHFQGALVISANGRFGIWCDHHRFDDRVCIALPSDVA
jgi:hypothetical protein